VKQKKTHGFTPVKQKKYWFHPDTIFRTYGAGRAGWIKIEQGGAGADYTG